MHCNDEQSPLAATGESPCVAVKAQHNQKLKKNKNLKNLLKSSIKLRENIMDFPGGSEVKASACNAPLQGSIAGFDPWVGKIPWRSRSLSGFYIIFTYL